MVGPLFAVTTGVLTGRGRSRSYDGESRLVAPGIRTRSPRNALRRATLPLRMGRSASVRWPWGRIRTEAHGADGSAARKSTSVNERELLVVVHGLQGATGDFNYVFDQLKETAACRSGQLEVYATPVNADNTHDGVAAGGKRVADDIRKKVESAKAEGKEIHRLSLLGFSLGGLYARYAAAVLYDEQEGTVAGVKAGSIILVASPHLGVRRFGVYRFVPGALRGSRMLSDTVKEMLIMDEPRILERMTRDDPTTVTQTTSTTPTTTTTTAAATSSDVAEMNGGCTKETAMKAAGDTNNNNNNNRSGSHGTSGNSNSSSSSTAGGGYSGSVSGAAHSITRMTSNISKTLSEGLRRKEAVQEHNEADERQARLPFVSALKAFEMRVLYANLRNDFMVNFGTGALEPGVSAIAGAELDRLMRAARSCAVDRAHDEHGCRVCFRYWVDGAGDGGTADDAGSEAVITGGPDGRDEGVEEVVMAQRLRALGWWIVGVDFPLALPIAHNRIVAMSRNIIHAWMNAPGKRVVHHLVDTICHRYVDHHPLFCRTNRYGDVMEGDSDSDDDIDDIHDVIPVMSSA